MNKETRDRRADLGKVARNLIIGLGLFTYLVMGLYTELKLVGIKPLPEKLIEDFQYYTWAFNDAVELGDPYQKRDIGTGFLYPPPALLVVGAYVLPSRLAQEHLGLDHFLLRGSALTITNVLLLCLMIVGIARRYGYAPSDVWWWFPLGLGFAPFLELLHLGQINVITQFGVFLMFLYAECSPWLGGLGLALGTVTKVTPLAFVGYLLVNRRLRAIAGTLAGLAGFILVTGMLFGWQPFATYGEVWRGLLDAFPLGTNAQSLVALLQSHGLISDLAVPGVQRGLTLYLALVFVISGAITYVSRRQEPLFIILSFGLALMPNVMWYHHYVFLLLPVLVWLGWSRMHPGVTYWCLAGLALIQIDRQASLLQASHGAAAHIFGHASILGILAWQIRQAITLIRAEPSLRALLRWHAPSESPTTPSPPA